MTNVFSGGIVYILRTKTTDFDNIWRKEVMEPKTLLERFGANRTWMEDEIAAVEERAAERMKELLKEFFAEPKNSSRFKLLACRLAGSPLKTPYRLFRIDEGARDPYQQIYIGLTGNFFSLSLFPVGEGWIEVNPMSQTAERQLLLSERFFAHLAAKVAATPPRATAAVSVL